MNPNDPSAGTEPGEVTGNGGPGADPAESVDPEGTPGHTSADTGTQEPRSEAPEAPGDPAQDQGTGPRFAPHDQPPRWATGPVEAQRVAFGVGPGTGAQVPYANPSGPHGASAVHPAGPYAGGGFVPPYGGSHGPQGPGQAGGPGHHNPYAPPGPGGQPPYGGMPPHGAPSGPGGPSGKKRGSGRIIGIAAATALITSLVVGPATALGTAYLFPDGLGGPVSSLSGEQTGTPTEGEVGEVADTVLPSVVSIQTASGGGSGVIISSDGQILTNAHVVNTGDTGPLQVMFNDGSTATAEVVGSDPVSDVAVIQAQDRHGLQAATLGDSDQVGVGADVVAIGSPLGLSGTVTSGIVSALDRPVNTGATESGGGQTSTVINAIQTDAAINPGNSGGPLVNMSGEVIGINTAIAGISEDSGSVGLGFAIPINQARPIAEQLIEDGSASYPAIEATIAADRTGGTVIVEVGAGGAAAEAGLEAGDVIVSIDSSPVTSPDQLIAEIRSRRPGDEVTLGVLRGGSGSEEQVTVTLGEQSSASVEEEGGN
ncbi:S1C family serine protease [Nocardiopsis algeriensis]|uniref:Putative serine protease PepD n=1 Tax=Nocardiopsis algeriensis TaxID=1478215 RepID=A0A841IS45_9ACTN|nr:trypsin-like peptidase domain-containing protein [Nocardiopsis algeriensis]MBB6121084.1 putative serine protease PepD [Nocardiopsis algeriensis]